MEIESLGAYRISLGECSLRRGWSTEPLENTNINAEGNIQRWEDGDLLSLAGFLQTFIWLYPWMLQSENSFSGSQHTLGKRVLPPARLDPWWPILNIPSHISPQAADCQKPPPSLQARQCMQGTRGSDCFCPVRFQCGTRN